MKPTQILLEFGQSGDNLVTTLRETFIDTFVFYLKAHGYHWNVEGPDFGPYHEFFGALAAEVYSTIDVMAEELRALGARAPYTFGEFEQGRGMGSSVLTSHKSVSMVEDLVSSNIHLLRQLRETLAQAEASKEFGLSNYIQDRIDAHNKWGWQLSVRLE